MGEWNVSLNMPSTISLLAIFFYHALLFADKYISLSSSGLLSLRSCRILFSPFSSYTPSFLRLHDKIEYFF